MLSSLVERRAGGQRRLPVEAGDGTSGRDLAPLEIPAAPELPVGPEDEAAGGATEDSAGASPGGGPESGSPPAPTPPGGTPPPPVPPEGWVDTAGRRRRQPGHFSLTILEEAAPGDDEVARLLETTVRVNTAHPAYRRADATRSLGYHRALCVAMALAPLAVEPPQTRDFVSAFLGHWGKVLDRPARRHRRRKAR